MMRPIDGSIGSWAAAFDVPMRTVMGPAAVTCVPAHRESGRSDVRERFDGIG